MRIRSFLKVLKTQPLQLQRRKTQEREREIDPDRERYTKSTRAGGTTEEPVFRYVDRAKRIALFPETRRDAAGEARRQIQRHGTA
jgi:hypothetical protein